MNCLSSPAAVGVLVVGAVDAVALARVLGPSIPNSGYCTSQSSTRGSPHISLGARVITIVLLSTALLVASGSPAFAHSPHDEIELVRLSRNFALDGTVYVIARDALMVSFDAALTWQRLARGLP